MFNSQPTPLSQQAFPLAKLVRVQEPLESRGYLCFGAEDTPLAWKLFTNGAIANLCQEFAIVAEHAHCAILPAGPLARSAILLSMAEEKQKLQPG